jgi:thiol-disulfide isomerase/thioredoxin
MKTGISFIFIFLSLVLCAQKQAKQGVWRGILILNAEKNTELPFNFEIKKIAGKTQLIIHNAEERITVTEIVAKKDSFNFKMPAFDSEFRCQLIGDTLLKGLWLNHSRTDNDKISFSAIYGNTNRFISSPTPSNSLFEGKWEITFSANTKDSSKAIGLFTHQKGSNYIQGTFLTETGDYRYLEGIKHEGTIYLSCFDGSHAFLFMAELNGTEITNGHFYSGSHWQEPWIGKRNDAFQLRNAETITHLKSENDKVNFSFSNLVDKKISINDLRYKNKPVIIQIMGSWCPNCLDETTYLGEIYNTYSKQGLEIIALCYERTTDLNKAKNNITRFKTKCNAQYEFLISGSSNKDKASESLAFLNEISAIPTTIVLDKNHTVKTIYTGFSGPATGNEYTIFKTKFEALVKDLVK